MAYRFARSGTTYGEPQSLAATLKEVSAKASQWGGAYRIKPPREEWSRELGRPLLLTKLASQLRKAAWGATFKIEMGTRRAVTATFLVRKVAPIPTPAPTEPLTMYTGAVVDLSRGNERIALAAQYAKDHCPRVQCSGWVYTRYVAGTTTWSQHSNFPTGGNAVDLTCYIEDDHTKGIDMDATQDVCDTLVAAARSGFLELDRVIFKAASYRYPGFAATPYSGVYHTHVHAEARPYQSATPVDA